MRYIGLLMVIVIAGCQDFSKPGFERCVAAEQAGKLEEALAECEKAAGLAKESDTGKAAAAKAEQLRPLAEKAKAERLAWEADAPRRAAAEAAEAKKAREAREHELLQKVRRRYYDTEPDSLCTGKGMPPYRWEYSGGTFAENAELAAINRCESPFGPGENTSFCCPMRPFITGF